MEHSVVPGPVVRIFTYIADLILMPFFFSEKQSLFTFHPQASERPGDVIRSQRVSAGFKTSFLIQKPGLFPLFQNCNT